MYFPIGWPKFYNAKSQTGKEDILKAIRFNRSRSLFVTVSNTCVYLWKTKPRLILAVWERDAKQIHDLGINVNVYWKPDSSMLTVVTDGGFMILLDIFEVKEEYIYHVEPINANMIVEQLSTNGMLKIEFSHRVTVTVKGRITSVSTRIDELFLTTTEGWLYRMLWDGTINSELSTSIYDLLFCVDFKTSTPDTPVTKDVHILKLESSPVFGGFAIVLSDGRGGFLTSPSSDSDMIGVFAKDLNNAVSLSINIKYQIIVFGQTNGQASAYVFDEATSGLILSHKYILPKRDHPDEGIHFGAITVMSWTPDGCSLATVWSKCGVAVWSVFGALLMCIQSSDFGGDVFHHEALAISSMDWGLEGYELVLIPSLPTKQEEERGVEVGDILALKFVKSALSVNPCMSNRQHLFLQGDDSVYLNTGDVMLQNGGDAMIGGINSPSMHFSNKHWQTFQVPSSYINSNWPIRYAAMDTNCRYLAIAGMKGYAHFSLLRRKWRLFGNETQEKHVTCRGGLTWWQDYLIVGCYNYRDDNDEIRIHHRLSNLDAQLAQSVKVSAPIFLLNTYNNLLLVYCSDCSVTFYRMEIEQNTDVNDPKVLVSKISETSLVEHLVHPITVTSLSLSGLKGEQLPTELLIDEKEAHSLIANVAGRVLMLQKDKPAAERSSKKMTFLPLLVIASRVENIWYMVKPSSTKQHLAESLWLACGAQGMQAWLPLFPTRRPLGFLSKRIMLHFDLNLYPLAVLFEDSVIVGIGNEDMDEFISTPTCVGKMAFPYFNLERTTQVFLPQILRQLLRRNLGVYALDIARSCTNLPYFTHVLELMLHEVLEKEATASNPIPDPLLPRVVAFIQEFPEFLETVCYCARKTEVALWRHLFSVVGDPKELFKSCHLTNKLDVAASYLLIIQSLESPTVSRQHATLLLETALDQRKWELARDLVRFLRAIGKGENESPPRTPAHIAHKSPLYPTPSSNFNTTSPNLDDTIPGTSPGMIPISRQTSRSSMSTTAVNPRTNSVTRDRSSSVKDKSRPPNLKLSKKDSHERLSTPFKSMAIESCEHFYIETILNRYARKLLTNCALLDLGTFAAHLDFDLVPWLMKERFRAACVDNLVRAMSAVHDQFEWPYPTSIRPGPFSSRSVSQLSTKEQLLSHCTMGTLTPTTPLESEISFPNTTADDIEAHLVSVAEAAEIPGGFDAFSDTASMLTACDEIGVDVLQGETPNMQKLDDLKNALLEKQQENDHSSTRKLKYLLKMFAEARCLDWVIILTLILFDLASFDQVVEKVFSFKDLTETRLDNLMSLLEDLNDWLEGKCPSYQPLLSTIIANCEILYDSVSLEDEANSTFPVASKGDELDRHLDGTSTPRSPRISESNDVILDTEDLDDEEKYSDEESEENEEQNEDGCVVS